MTRGWFRRYAPMLLVLAAILWIIVIIVWISVSPTAGTGNPME